ncbi:MAG: hypothetical protein ABI047_02985 [Jatrophihabitantaceae bacterium]
MVENDVQEMGGSLTDQSWERALAVLDQGELGSCTGNAGAGALGTQPFYDAVGSAVLPPDTDAAERFAVKLYSDATAVDVFRAPIRLLTPGPPAWPSARCSRAAASSPATGGPERPTGSSGYSNMASSRLAGGHEVEAVGVELNTANVFSSSITYVNSWGPGWGDDGRFRMRLRSYDRLSGVDLKQYLI